MTLSIIPLDEIHLSKGFIECLKQLTKVGKIDIKDSKKQLQEIKSNKNHYIRIAFDDEKDMVVGSATMLIEPKFIHNLGRVAHIEDVVVRNNFRRLQIGSKI